MESWKINGAHLRLYKMPVDGLELVCSTPDKCGGNITLPVNPLTPIKEACIDDDVAFSKKKKDKRIPLTPVKKGKENKISNSQQTDKQDGKGRYDKEVYH